MEISLEWGATRICTRAYFIVGYINDLEEDLTGKIFKFADATKLFRKTKDILEINKNYKMTLIN